METVNKYVNSASTVIWGENGSPQTQQHGEEPISGVQGKGCVTDPYDGGNRDGKYNNSKDLRKPQLLDCHNAIKESQNTKMFKLSNLAPQNNPAQSNQTSTPHPSIPSFTTNDQSPKEKKLLASQLHTPPPPSVPAPALPPLYLSPVALLKPAEAKTTIAPAPIENSAASRRSKVARAVNLPTHPVLRM